MKSNFVILPYSTATNILQFDFTEKVVCSEGNKSINLPELGLIWLCCKDRKPLQKQLLRLGWNCQSDVVFIITDEKQWLLTKLKYGV